MKSIFSEDILKIFEQVAVTGSFTAAAQALGLTPSAVSHSIKRIETYLDAPLFTRQARTVTLTHSGEYLLKKTTMLLDEFGAIKRSIESIDANIALKIRLCLNNLLHTPHHTAELLTHLKRRFPLCEFSISTEVYNGVWDALLHQSADVAIGAPGIVIDGGGLNYTDIGYIDWLFVVAPDHPLAKAPEPIAESTLRSYPNVFIADTAQRVNKRVGWLLYGQEVIKVTDWETKKRLQMMGTGIGFVPASMVQQELADGRLVAKKIKNPRQPSKQLLVIKQELKGEFSYWLEQAFAPGGVLADLYQDLLRPGSADGADVTAV
ncbi:LysR substrate-binding domain-containing protein [Neisseriaceae bacterium CLB008]|nr:LysR family transcriptional regulator [Neisseriaceae bacterium]